jgi:hypothetical protein
MTFSWFEEFDRVRLWWIEKEDIISVIYSISEKKNQALQEAIEENGICHDKKRTKKR